MWKSESIYVHKHCFLHRQVLFYDYTCLSVHVLSYAPIPTGLFTAFLLLLWIVYFYGIITIGSSHIYRIQSHLETFFFFTRVSYSPAVFQFGWVALRPAAELSSGTYLCWFSELVLLFIEPTAPISRIIPLFCPPTFSSNILKKSIWKIKLSQFMFNFLFSFYPHILSIALFGIKFQIHSHFPVELWGHCLSPNIQFWW